MMLVGRRYSIVILVLSLAAAIASPLFAVTYYVDSENGSDSHPGTSPLKPWRSLERVRATPRGAAMVYQAGDRILLKGSQAFPGYFYFDAERARGAADNPIIIGTYGEGRAAIHSGNAPGLYAADAAGFRIANINFVGTSLAAGIYDVTGIWFNNNRGDPSPLETLTIQDVDVTGFGESGIGVYSQNGTAGFRNVRITNVNVYGNGGDGVSVRSLTHGYSPCIFNLYIGYSSVHGNAGNPAQAAYPTGSGIFVSNVENGLIEYCRTFENGVRCGAGPAQGGPYGIWVSNSSSINVQHNESFNNKNGPAGNAGGGGFYFDSDVSDSLLQYNYSHHNQGAGFLLYGYRPDNAVDNITARYNISEGDGERFGTEAGFLVRAFSRMEDVHIYNNTVYKNAGGGPAVEMEFAHNPPGSRAYARNNILFTDNNQPQLRVTGLFSVEALLFQNNSYFANDGAWRIEWDKDRYTTPDGVQRWSQATGQEMIGDFYAARVGDPRLCAPGKGGADGAQAYLLQEESSLINQGADLHLLFRQRVGPQDFYGHKIPSVKEPVDKPDVGANEYKTGQTCDGGSAVPRISRHPESQTVTSGQTASFSVQTDGVRLQWERFDKQNNTWKAIPGADGSVYTTPINSMANHLDAYRCVISNAAGTVWTQMAVVRVLPPFLVHHPRNEVVLNGRPATFFVQVREGTPPYRFRWQRSDDRGKTFNAIPQAPDSAAYTIPNPTVGADNNAMFRVVVEDVSEEAITSEAASLYVVNSPPPNVSLGRGVVHGLYSGAEAAMIRNGGGFGMVRIYLIASDPPYDFYWADHQMELLTAYGMRAYVTLTAPRPPVTAPEREAFAQYVATAVNRYKGRGHFWEVWNEPNLSAYWDPPDAAAYSALAIEAGNAVKQAAPNEIFVVGALSPVENENPDPDRPEMIFDMDFAFMRRCFEAGILTVADAVSFHPYAWTFYHPALLDRSYARLRDLIAEFAPKGKNIALVASEIGFPSDGWTGGEVSEELQAKSVPLDFLIHASNHIPVTLEYNWKDGRGPDWDDHCGLVRAYDDPPPDKFDPKPAFFSAKAVNFFLKDAVYQGRMPIGDVDDYALHFTRNGEDRWAVMTASGLPQAMVLPVSPGLYRIVSYDGESFRIEAAGPGGLPVTLAYAPQYIVPEVSNKPPQVDAGPDQRIALPAFARMNGSVADDGRPWPPGGATATWTKVSGPGDVTFSAPDGLRTQARFLQPGVYVLRLTANDGDFAVPDDVRVTVDGGGGGGAGAPGSEPSLLPSVSSQNRTSARAADITIVPNPFSFSEGHQHISISNLDPQDTHIDIYDPHGRLVIRIPITGKTAEWNGTDDSGKPVASGVYRCVVHGRGRGETLKVGLIR